MTAFTKMPKRDSNNHSAISRCVTTCGELRFLHALAHHNLDRFVIHHQRGTAEAFLERGSRRVRGLAFSRPLACAGLGRLGLGLELRGRAVSAETLGGLGDARNAACRFGVLVVHVDHVKLELYVRDVGLEQVPVVEHL